MRSVLVAEDDIDIRDLIAFKLEQAGFRVHVVADGEAALKAAATEHFDLVILDVMMPKRTGIEVCQELRRHRETVHLPVLLLTARAQEADIERGFAVGADDYLTKPFSPRELISRVQVAVARGERMRAPISSGPSSDDESRTSDADAGRLNRSG